MINPMHAAALFLLVGKLRPSATWVLVGWSFAWYLVIGLVQLVFQPVPDLTNPDASSILGGFLSSLAITLPLALLGWALPFAAWMRLLTTGRGSGLVPFRLGGEEMWAVFVLLALVFGMSVVMGLVFFVLAILTALAPPLAALGFIVAPAVGVAGIYVSIRLTPAAALSSMTHKFAVLETWHEMDGKTGSAFLAWLVVVVASIVLGLAVMVIGMLVPDLSLQQEMSEMMLGGDRPSLVALVPGLIFSLAAQLPVTLMSYSVAAYFALAISGRDDDWTREIQQAEAEAE